MDRLRGKGTSHGALSSCAAGQPKKEEEKKKKKEADECGVLGSHPGCI